MTRFFRIFKSRTMTLIHNTQNNIFVQIQKEKVDKKTDKILHKNWRLWFLGSTLYDTYFGSSPVLDQLLIN